MLKEKFLAYCVITRCGFIRKKSMPNGCGKTWGGATLILSYLRDQDPTGQSDLISIGTAPAETVGKLLSGPKSSV